MKFYQKEIRLRPHQRGFHLITQEIISNFHEINNIEIGQLQVFIKHTSASLTINENADSTVRQDFESHFNKMVPENMPYYIHTYEGSDDMPAHIKGALTQTTLTIPLSQGRLALGTWQGIFLFEHRAQPHTRNLVLHMVGE